MQQSFWAAVVISDVLVQVYKESPALTMEKLREAGVSWKDVFEEIPIMVKNSNLAVALTASVESDKPIDQRDADQLNVSVRPLLEKNLDFLNDCLDDIVTEQQKVLPLPQHAASSLLLLQCLSVWLVLQNAWSCRSVLTGRNVPLRGGMAEGIP